MLRIKVYILVPLIISLIVFVLYLVHDQKKQKQEQEQIHRKIEESVLNYRDEYYGYLNCENGGFIDETKTFKTCTCSSPYWNGINCDQCTHSSVCSGNNVCDTSLILDNGKNYECTIENKDFHSLIGDKIDLHCDNDQCLLRVFGEQLFHENILNRQSDIIQYFETFNCTLMNLTTTYDSERNRYTVNSKSSRCYCNPFSSKCKDEQIINDVVNQMTGSSKINCDVDTGHCLIIHKDFPGELDVLCTGGGCLKDYLPFPENNTIKVVTTMLSWEGWAAFPFGFLFFIALRTLIES